MPYPGGAAAIRAAIPKDIFPTRLLPSVNRKNTIATAEAHENAGTRRGTGGLMPAILGVRVKLRGTRRRGVCRRICFASPQVLQDFHQFRVILDLALQARFFRLRKLVVQVGGKVCHVGKGYGICHAPRSFSRRKAAGKSSAKACRHSRNLRRARANRDFIVPRGTLAAWATSS